MRDGSGSHVQIPCSLTVMSQLGGDYKVGVVRRASPEAAGDNYTQEAGGAELHAEAHPQGRVISISVCSPLCFSATYTHTPGMSMPPALDPSSLLTPGDHLLLSPGGLHSSLSMRVLLFLHPSS